MNWVSYLHVTYSLKIILCSKLYTHTDIILMQCLLPSLSLTSPVPAVSKTEPVQICSPRTPKDVMFRRFRPCRRPKWPNSWKISSENLHSVFHSASQENSHHPKFLFSKFTNFVSECVFCKKRKKLTT